MESAHLVRFLPLDPLRPESHRPVTDQPVEIIRSGPGCDKCNCGHRLEYHAREGRVFLWKCRGCGWEYEPTYKSPAASLQREPVPINRACLANVCSICSDLPQAQRLKLKANWLRTIYKKGKRKKE